MIKNIDDIRFNTKLDNIFNLLSLVNNSEVKDNTTRKISFMKFNNHVLVIDNVEKNL